MIDTTNTQGAPNRTTQRIQHQLRPRLVTVKNIERLSPHMLRFTFEGEELQGFSSPGFDDHVKLCFPDPETAEIILPGSGSEKKPLMREYTPHHYNPATNTLEIDFVIHDTGIATNWATQAKTGDQLGIVGPKSSFIIPADFDWYLLIGDETAIPAIARRLQELPANSLAIAIIEVDSTTDEIHFHSTANLQLHWLHRSGNTAGTADLIIAKLNAIDFPAGDFYTWIACEYSVVKILREKVVSDYGANKQWLRAASYWQK